VDVSKGMTLCVVMMDALLIHSSDTSRHIFRGTEAAKEMVVGTAPTYLRILLAGEMAQERSFSCVSLLTTCTCE
jgi:hypothetical protein